MYISILNMPNNSVNSLHLESEYNILVANTVDGFYLLKLPLTTTNYKSETLVPTGPFCVTYKPYLVRMISPFHCLFVTEKNNDPMLLTINVNDNDNAFPKSYTIMVFNTEQNKIILHFTIGHKITNIVTIDKYILVITLNQILVYTQNIVNNLNDPNNVSFVKTIHTFTNPLGLCSAKSYKNNLVIATLGRTIGEVMICTLKKRSNIYIQAHTNTITNITLDDKCELISTTSNSGTLINVFDISNCAKVYQFRRGIFGTTIHDVKFDASGNYISCCSDNGTVHMFHLYDKCSESTDHKNTTSSFSIFGPIVPVCQSEWAYKLFKINQCVKSTCYFKKLNDKINIHITSNDFIYYIVNDIENNQDIVIKHDIGKLITKS